MQKRLISSFIGGIAGIGVAWRYQDSLGLSETLAYVACAVGGIAVAWVASTLFDVFAGTHSGTTPE